MKRTVITLLLAALVLPASASATPAAGPQLRSLVGALGGDPGQAGSARYGDLGKLDGRVQQLAADRLTGSASRAATTAGLTTSGSRVLVDIYVDGDVSDAAAALRAQGMDVTALSRTPPQRMVEGWLPARTTPDVAALDSTTAVVPVVQPRLAAAWPGAAVSQGDAAHRDPAARAFGATGAGIAVGVMSDSINKVGGGVAGSQASGDLPANVQILQDGPAGETDEGRAMAEIIYDEAPGISKLLFATADGGAANKANNIGALVSQGARIIADDTSYFGQPWFQDGAITQAVDRARASGATYVVSAGNEGRQSWEGTFTPASDPTLNNFGGGLTTHVFASLPTNTVGRTVEVQWAEPWGSAPDKFQVTLTAPGAAAITGTNATGIPDIVLSTPAEATARIWSIAIKRIAGSGTPFLKYIVSGGSTNLTGSAADTGPTIAGDASAAAGAITVAAVQSTSGAASSLTTPETFSSRGPVTIRFDTAGTPISPVVRNKPEVAGADGVSTTVAPGLGLGCSTVSVGNCFFGTSAAAPSIAGIGALVLSARPSLTPTQLAAILTNPAYAIDCTSAAGQPDTDCGAGFLQADRAVQSLDDTPPVVSASTAPAASASGWTRGPVAVAWTTTDPDSTVSSSAGCGPQTLSGDGIATLTCTARSVGGTGTGSLTVKYDSTPPTAPVIAGIAGTTYTQGDMPTAATCTSTDASSGLASCSVTPVLGTVGPHTLTATATDQVGLTSTSTLTYTVVPPPDAIRSVSVAAVRRATLLAKGLRVTLHGTQRRLKVQAILVATYTTGSGRKKRARRVTVARRTTTLTSSGQQRFTLTLSRRGRATLRARGTTTLVLTVAGTAPDATSVAITRKTRMTR